MARTAESVKELADGELIDQVAQVKDELFRLRFQNATGQLENTALLGQLRKQVARLNTEIRDREIAAAEALAANEESS
jgi:large subunit ribosomal protein L29